MIVLGTRGEGVRQALSRLIEPSVSHAVIGRQHRVGADNPVRSGDLHVLVKLCAKLLSFAGPLELYGEEIDPQSGQHLGNFPQAFTHLALINAVLHVIKLEGHVNTAEPSGPAEAVGTVGSANQNGE